jgi:hypothetical protein
MRRILGTIAIAVALLLAGASPSSAQIRAPKAKQQRILPKNGPKAGLKGKAAPGAALERFMRMSPEEQRAVLEQLPPARRRQVMQRLRALLLLSQEEQRLLRGRFDAFSSLEADRQEALRGGIQELRQLSRPDRRGRLADPWFRQRFSEDELQLLYEVAGVPDPE